MIPYLTVIVPRYAMNEVVAARADTNIELIRRHASIWTQIVVVDNGSAVPYTRAVTGIQVVSWPENRGIAPAWNEGRRRAICPVLAFVTQTTEVTPGWDLPLIGVAEDGPLIAMPMTNGVPGGEPGHPGVSGWCWVITAHQADRVGPFDETFSPAWYEDSDFFWRAIRAGLELVTVPTSNVLKPDKHHAANAAPWASRKTLLFHAQRLRFAWKHGLDPEQPPPFWQRPLRQMAPPEPAGYGTDYTQAALLRTQATRYAASQSA